MKFRRFLATILVLSMLLSCLPAVSAAEGTGITDLIPDEANLTTPNYVCTWSNQDWTALSSDASKAYSSSVPRDMLNHDQLFDPETGWCYTAYQDSKQDLIFLLDDGWDLPYSSKSNYMSFFASCLVDEEKFPGYGDTPQERLKTLVDNIEVAGWKGAGVWICANTNTEDYWRERLEWSAYAGVDYWKIDWGSGSGSTSWRQMISNLADEIAPDLVIEHIVGYSTLNTSADGGTRMSDSVAQASADRGSFADVYRTYDVNGNLSIATTFERIGKHMQYAYTDGRQLGLLNGEDEVYMCSALGLIFGVMRYDIGDASSGSLPNIFFGGAEDFTESRPIRKMADEVQRATMWQRIAPAYRVDAYKTVISDEALADSWIYSSEDTWDTGTTSAGSGTAKVQKAPAIIARGIDMPVVKADANGVKPFVAVSRNPNGAISIGTYGRTTPADGYQAVYSDITLNAGDLTGKIGVFGYYDSLTLTFNQDLTGKTIYAQDMMNTVAAEDITDLASISADGKSVTFSGELLSRIGLSGATEQYSEPGLVIQIGDEADFVEAPETIASSLIPNSSFEYTVTGENGQLDARNWTETGTAANAFVETGNAKNGSCYAALQQSAGMNASASIPNGIYNISAWVRTGTLIGSAAMTVSGYGGEAVSVAITENGEWTKIVAENVAVTSGSVNVAFAINGAAGEYLHVDAVDIALSEDVELIADLIAKALAEENGSDDMDQAALQDLVDGVLWAYEGTGISAEVSDFALIPSSDSDNGVITAAVTVSNGTESKTISVKLLIPKKQVVYNPSFEIGSTVNGDAPQGWDIWAADGYDVNAFCYVESKSDWMGGAHTGSWYGSTWGMKFECSTSQTVSVPNGKYNVSVWVQNTAFTGTDYTDTGCAGYFGVKGYGGKTRFVSLDEERTEWTKLTIEDVVVTTGKIELGMYLNNDTGTEHWVKFDDFSVEPVASAITVAGMRHGTVEVSRTEAIAGAQVTVTAVPENQYRLIEGSLKVYKTNDPSVTVSVTDSVFTMPGYGVTVEAKFESATPQTYQYLPVEQLTGYAESWSSDSCAPSMALDGNTAKGSNWHTNYPGGLAETEDNHYLMNTAGEICQNSSGGADKPLGKYNNFYIVLDEAMMVDKVSIYGLWDNQVTNGTAKEVKVYVSDQDYGQNKDIAWGDPVGASPEGGFTYAGADDMNKEVVFDQPQTNVKSIRIEFIRTYENGGTERNKWIRVMEFGISAKEIEEVVETGPETIEKSRLTGYAESWQSGADAAMALDGDTWSNWHSMYSGTETDENHITEDASGNETISGGGVPMAKYNNYYIVIDEPATVENISIHGKYDGGITNGTVKKCKVYVSAEDYSQNKDIDWGQAVGSSPEEGFTYAGPDDMKKIVEFAQAQEGVKSIRIEFTESYSGSGHKESKWIRVTEFDLNEFIAKTPDIPALPEEDPLYTIVAVSDYHTDYGIEVSGNPVRDSVITAMERIREEEEANVIVALGDLISANDTSHWFAGSAADRENIYNKALSAMYTATESGMADPMVMYIAGNHETEVGCKDFNSQSFVEDGTERTMGQMIAATSVTDMEANAYFETDLSAVLNNADGQRNVLAYHYNVDGLDFIALNPPYMGQRNSNGVFEYDADAMEWVSNKMAAIGSDKTVIMIGHYPVGTDFRGTDSASLTAESDQILRDILRDYPNTIYLYGHVHDDYINSDTYETIVAYEQDARTVYTDRFSAPTGVITAFAGSMGYYGYPAGLVPQGGLSAQTPNYIQALMVYIYADRIVFQMKNYGTAGGELEPYTVMRQVSVDSTVDKTLLGQLIEQAEDLSQDDYSQELWTILTESLTTGREVYDNPDATRRQVERAVSALEKALELAQMDLGFVGKTISILGDSISTYEGVSQGDGAKTSNSTISGNDLYYTKGMFGVTQADTWWQQAADRLGMRVLVNNSWSGSTVFSIRDWPDPVSKGYLERTQNLHDDTGDNAGEEPDIIAVFMGTNDFSDNQALGEAVTDHTTLITENEDGTYSYKTPTTLAEGYSIMLYRITRRYPNAEIYCLSLLAREDASEEDAQRMERYSQVFKATAEYYGAVFVDQYHDSGITSDSNNAAWYMGNKLHPNPAGMDAITNSFISALLKHSAYSTVKDELAQVSYELDGAIVKEGTIKTAVLGDPFAIGFVDTADKALFVDVTMNGEDVTDAVYADGCVDIDQVSGDIWIRAVVEAEKSTLALVLNRAEGLVETDYIPESWQSFTEVLAEAKAVMNDERAGQKTVDAAVEAMLQAIESLEEKSGQQKYEEAMELVEQANKLSQEAAAAAETARAEAQAALEAARQAQKVAEEIIDISDENTEAAIAAAEAAEAAQKKADDAAARSEAAELAAETAAEAAADAAEAAESANTEAAAKAVQAAADALSAAQSQAQAAQAAAQAAQNAVTAAQAQKAAQEAKNKADEARQAAQAAQDRAEQAQADAEAAAAESAEDRGAALAAQAAAEDAKKAAESSEAQAQAAEKAAAAAAQEANKALKDAENASNEAMHSALQAAREAAHAAEAAETAARQAAVIAEYAAETAAAQRSAQEAQARAEQAKKEAEEAAKKAEQERLEAEEARKKAEAEAEAAKKAAELETGKQAALARILIYTDGVDAAALDDEKLQAYTDIVYTAMDNIDAAQTIEQANEAVNAMIAQLEELLAVHECFEDVDQNEWYHEAVDYVFENGHMVGVSDTRFDPMGELTRAQFATILHRLAGAPEMEYADTFTDVADGQWYTDAILWANENGVVLGYTDGSFGVDDIITREAMIVMLHRYTGSWDDEADLESFADSALVSDWAGEAMGWAVSVGLVRGSSENGGLYLNPQGSTTRAECAAIVQRFLENGAE